MTPDTDIVDGYACPLDPMDALQCDSCQKAQKPINFGGPKVHRR